MKTLHRPMLLISLFLFTPAHSTEKEKSTITPHKQRVSRKNVDTLSYALYQKIKNDTFKPDVIIALARGGWAPAHYLAGERMFNIRDLRSIGVESYNDNMQQNQIKLTTPFHPEDYAGLKNILVVDDLVDTGRTFEFVKKLLQDKLSNVNIVMCALFCKTKKNSFVPDYYMEDTERWLVFPTENQ